MAVITRLIGVYDADGGLRGELAYLAGKIAGRHCSLCDITHSPVRRRQAWDAYVAELPVPFEVVHRNERTDDVRAATTGKEPCVVAQTDDGGIVLVMSAERLADAADVAGLARELDRSLAEHGLQWPSHGGDDQIRP